MQVAIIDNVPLFFQERDGPWCPTLRILHQYPDMMPKLRADKGAIKFVLSGANIMCPGLTSPGATLHVEVRSDNGLACMPSLSACVARADRVYGNLSVCQAEANTAVAIYAEGKEHAMAVGLTKMSTAEMREVSLLPVEMRYRCSHQVSHSSHAVSLMPLSHSCACS